MTWQVVSISCPGDESAREVADLLVALGAGGVVETLEPGGRTTLEAWYEEGEVRLQSLEERLPEDARLEVRRERERDWETWWRRGLGPVRLSPRIGVRPPWSERTDLDPDAHWIPVEPGLAFGTGLHPTTRICARLLDRALEGRRGLSVLDVGSGTGVLSVAAAHLGGDPVVALDRDPVAARATRRTARRSEVRLLVACAGPSAIGRSFDLVVANLDLETVRSSGSDLVARVGPEGLLVVSGLRRSPEEGAVARDLLEPVVGSVRERIEEAGWLGLTFRRG